MGQAEIFRHRLPTQAYIPNSEALTEESALRPLRQKASECRLSCVLRYPGLRNTVPMPRGGAFWLRYLGQHVER